MTALADFRTRIRAVLVDTAGAIYVDAIVDEALSQALHEYNQALPLHMDTVIDLIGDGREIALNEVTGLIGVLDVYWPYDSLSEVWPPNRVRGFYLYWDDTEPVLYLNQIDGDQPQLDDELRLSYTKLHTIANLASATETTIPARHESVLVSGAAAHAAMSRTIDLVEVTSADQYATGLLGTWAQRKLKEFRAELQRLQSASARTGQAYGEGWKLDKWDQT